MALPLRSSLIHACLRSQGGLARRPFLPGSVVRFGFVPSDLSTTTTTTRRAFASTTKGEEQSTPSTVSTVTKALVRVKDFATSRTGIAVIGSSAVFILVSRMVYDVMHYAIHLDFYTVGEIGIAVGLVSASLTFGGAVGVYRATTIRAEKVFLDSYERLSKSSPVVDALTSSTPSSSMATRMLASGSVGTSRTRAYQMDYGALGLDSIRPVWRKPRVVMAYKIVGSTNEGLALVDTEREISGRLTVRSLSVEFPDRLVVVEGDEADAKAARERLLPDVAELTSMAGVLTSPSTTTVDSPRREK